MEDIILLSPFPNPRKISDGRSATDDGYIWPVARERMTTPAAIIQRMAEDIQTIIRDRGMDGAVTTEDLIRKGWPRSIVNTYGLDASRACASREAA